jgi:hypothetical protein
MAGFWQLYRAFKEVRKLRQSLIYLVGIFADPPPLLIQLMQQ